MTIRQGRLLRKYALVFGALVGGTLIAGSVVQLSFSYQESQAAILQRERVEASRAAVHIRQFVDGMTEKLVAILPPPGLTDYALEDRMGDFLSLQSRAPEIDDTKYIDKNGGEQVSVSRLALNQLRYARDRSSDPEFRSTRSGDVYYSEVDFRGGSEPYFRIAVPERDGGVTAATVDLRFLLDYVSSIKIGERGHAYVVDEAGRLIAHPDISLVLKLTPLSDLAQVREAIASDPARTDMAMMARDASGKQVLTAFETIPTTHWAVFVEQPLEEAFAPLTSSLWRAGGILAIGLAIAIAASLALTRRMIEPIEMLRAGAARIGDGALDQRIAIQSGDELEDLADEFNRMASRLGESYATLEQKVADRTHELAAARDELAAVSRHKSEFLANMSHELRAPLNAIIGFSKLLLEKGSGDLTADQEQYVRDILDAGRHQVAVINDVLDISKVEAGRLELETSTVSVSKAVSDALAFVRAPAAQHRIDLCEELETDIGEVSADARKVRQILVNLLSNAVKFTPDAGRVVVRGTRADGHVTLSVSDTGAGIAPDELGRIFREFTQTSSARGREGTGLGLALTKRLVELHGGRIWAESAVGKGSTFTFVLPVVSSKP